ncbi:MAG: nucleoside hydrolase [Planctomycetota bacterium]|jgi:hypothetical protein
MSVSIIHTTDLYRPYLDQDDHWDLACLYALAYEGQLDLKGVVVDYPSKNPKHKNKNPDIAAVAQMNYITGLNVPVAVGSSYCFKAKDDTQPYARSNDHNGSDMLIEILKKSDAPAVINISGSCCDVALAANKEPELFADKCAGVYMNAGTGSQNKELVASMCEWNMKLDKFAYAAMFDLPCPVYWLPCSEVFYAKRMEYGTLFKFCQEDIMPDLSEKVQNYFAYMYGKFKDGRWLQYIDGKKDEELLANQYKDIRLMCCTGGIFHASGKTVTCDGEIMSLENTGDGAVFKLEPVKVNCDEECVTEWSHDESSTNRFIFHVLDIDNYHLAMAKALKQLLISLP